MLFAYACSFAVWENIKSPITGAASAAQLDDTIASYIAARAISNNIPEQIGTLVFALAICATWLPSHKKSTK